MKRLKINGKSQTKHDLMYLIGQINPCDPWTIYDTYLYAEYVERLQMLLESKYSASARVLGSTQEVACVRAEIFAYLTRAGF